MNRRIFGLSLGAIAVLMVAVIVVAIWYKRRAAATSKTQLAQANYLAHKYDAQPAPLDSPVGPYFEGYKYPQP